MNSLNAIKFLEILNSNKTPYIFSIYRLKNTFKPLNFVPKPFLMCFKIRTLLGLKHKNFSIFFGNQEISENFRINNEISEIHTVSAQLERYMMSANMDCQSKLPLVRPLKFFKSTNTFELCRRKVSYSRCRKIFKSCLSDLGYDSNQFGLHSLRSGGATAAVRSNENLSERDFKCMVDGNQIMLRSCTHSKI